MKKIALLFALVVSVAIFAQIGFRRTQSLCSGNEQVILKTDHSAEVWDNNMLIYSGTWEYDGGAAIIMSFEGAKIRCQVSIGKDANISRLTFNGTNYYPCRQ